MKISSISPKLNDSYHQKRHKDYLSVSQFCFRVADFSEIRNEGMCCSIIHSKPPHKTDYQGFTRILPAISFIRIAELRSVIIGFSQVSVNGLLGYEGKTQTSTFGFI